MTHETGKAVARRLHDVRYLRWITGSVIDIGSGDDPFDRYAGLFPGVTAVRCFDKPHGDAQVLPGADGNSFDTVLSSHCLEHLADPFAALRTWIRVCKPGGHLLITVPDEDLYEHGQWPSRFNAEHRWSFTLSKASDPARPHRINVLELLLRLPNRFDILSLQVLDAGFDPGIPKDYDQSLLICCEPAIEIVLRKGK